MNQVDNNIVDEDLEVPGGDPPNLPPAPPAPPAQGPAARQGANAAPRLPLVGANAAAAPAPPGANVAVVPDALILEAAAELPQVAQHNAVQGALGLQGAHAAPGNGVFGVAQGFNFRPFRRPKSVRQAPPTQPEIELNVLHNPFYDPVEV